VFGGKRYRLLIRYKGFFLNHRTIAAVAILAFEVAICALVPTGQCRKGRMMPAHTGGCISGKDLQPTLGKLLIIFCE
jgi:hypothetical protein